MDNDKVENIKDYCLNRPLFRPDVTYIKLLLYCIAYVLIFFTFVVATIFIINCILNQKWMIVISILLTCLLFLGTTIKYIFMKAIECYQHYASEELRRSCVCKPTCSEYALIALKKYNLIKACSLIYTRLTRGCSSDYHEDYP